MSKSSHPVESLSIKVGRGACSSGSTFLGSFSTVAVTTLFIDALFLRVRSRIDPTIAMTTTRAIAPAAPKLPIAPSNPACEVTEDELNVTDVGRMMVVVVMLEELIVVAVVLEELIVSVNIMDAGKLNSTVAVPDV